MTSTPSRPNITGIAARMTSGLAEPVQAITRLQDKFNLDVQQAVGPLLMVQTWTPLTPQNGWVPYGQGQTPPSWRYGPGGLVLLRGVIRSGSTSTTVDLFTATVPSPTYKQDIGCLTNSGVGELLIFVGGHIRLASGGTSFMSMDGLSYDPSA